MVNAKFKFECFDGSAVTQEWPQFEIKILYLPMFVIYSIAYNLLKMLYESFSWNNAWHGFWIIRNYVNICLMSYFCLLNPEPLLFF